MKTDWSEVTHDDAHDVVRDVFESDTVGNYQASINAQNARALYNGTEVTGLYAVHEPGCFNVVQSIADTMTSHLQRNRVLPMFLTEGGDFDAQRRAKGLEKAVRGEFEAQGVYGQLGHEVARDGLVFGDGFVEVVIDEANRRLVLERVMSHHLRVSWQESRWSEPRSLCRLVAVDRGKLAAMYPDQSAAIHDAPRVDPSVLDGSDGMSYQMDRMADMVMVYRAWHLPSGRVERNEKTELDASKVSHDGRRIVAIHGATLELEAYGDEFFPVARFRHYPKIEGWRGRGVPEQLVSLQWQIDEYSRRIATILRNHANVWIYTDRRAKIATSKLSSGALRLIEGNGPGGVQPITMGSIPADLVNQRQRLIQEAYDQYGVSQLTAHAQKPAGIEHAPGLQLVLDTESVRHTTAFRAWEMFHVQLARLVVAGFRRLASADSDMRLVFPGEKSLESLEWSDVDLDEDRFVVKVWPTNLLPKTPSALLDRVAQMQAAGQLSQEEANQLLDFPDIQAARGDVNARRRNIERKLELLADGDEEAAAPHPLLDLGLAFQMGRDRVNALEADGADDETLERFRRWALGVQEFLAAATRQQAEQSAQQQVQGAGAQTAVMQGEQA